MRFTPDLAVAFGDWLECDAIRRALLVARPELAPAVEIDPQRPLLRIRRDGDSLLVARSAEEHPAAWLVGVAETPHPVLHEVETAEAAAALVLELLDRP